MAANVNLEALPPGAGLQRIRPGRSRRVKDRDRLVPNARDTHSATFRPRPREKTSVPDNDELAVRCAILHALTGITRTSKLVVSREAKTLHER